MAKIRKSQNSSGTAAIEFGLILPVLLLFTFGIIDFGLLLWTNTTLTRATQAAARCGALSSTACPDVKAYAVRQAWGIHITSGAFTAGPATCGYKVSATYIYNFLTPWLPQFGGSPLGTVTLAPSACYPTQSG